MKNNNLVLVVIVAIVVIVGMAILFTNNDKFDSSDSDEPVISGDNEANIGGDAKDQLSKSKLPSYSEQQLVD